MNRTPKPNRTASLDQIGASRTNAARSTGPRTPQGKAAYQPVNSQEPFALERMVIAQQTILRASLPEPGLFTTCLNAVHHEFPSEPISDLEPEQTTATYTPEQSNPIPLQTPPPSLPRPTREPVAPNPHPLAAFTLTSAGPRAPSELSTVNCKLQSIFSPQILILWAIGGV